MNILIRTEEDVRIFGFLNGTVTDEGIDYMEHYIETMPKDTKCRFAINLHNVNKISKKLMDFITRFQTMLCCINAEILVSFMLTRVVNHISCYISEGDLIENRRRILKRDFALC